MTWVRLDDGFDEDPRIVEAGLAAAGLLALLLCFSNRGLTDGYVPSVIIRQKIRTESKRALLRRMIRLGLLAPCERDGIRGYQIHADFTGLQPSRADVLALRATRAAIGRKGGLAKGKQPASKQLGKSEAKPCPVPARPDPDVQKEPLASADAPAADGFPAFWAAYPRRVGRLKAEQVWRKLKASADLVAIITAAVHQHAASPQWMKDGGQYVPHPATWLSQRRWEDELEVVNGNGGPASHWYDNCHHIPPCTRLVDHQFFLSKEATT